MQFPRRKKTPTSHRVRLDSDRCQLSRFDQGQGIPRVIKLGQWFGFVTLESVTEEAGEVWLQLSVDFGKAIKQTQVLTLRSYPANLGGVRWFWHCPQCGSRRKHLYSSGRVQGHRFACRECLELAYWWSQQNRRPGTWLDRFLGMPGANQSLEDNRAYERRVEHRIRRCESRRAYLRRKANLARDGSRSGETGPERSENPGG